MSSPPFTSLTVPAGQMEGACEAGHFSLGCAEYNKCCDSQPPQVYTEERLSYDLTTEEYSKKSTSVTPFNW